MRNPIFVDFEASSLSEASWPIEIGFAWIDENEKLHSSSKLIRSHLNWEASDWSEVSEEVHGITRAEIAIAEEAQAVARWAVRELGSALILSDAPSFDGRWMNRLMKTIDQEDAFEVFSIQDEACLRFEGPILRAFLECLNARNSKHRAGDDALCLAHAWRNAIQSC